MPWIIAAEAGDLTPGHELIQIINATTDFYRADAPGRGRAERAVLLSHPLCSEGSFLLSGSVSCIRDQQTAITEDGFCLLPWPCETRAGAL